jgi:hypothetical protein
MSQSVSVCHAAKEDFLENNCSICNQKIKVHSTEVDQTRGIVFHVEPLICSLDQTSWNLQQNCQYGYCKSCTNMWSPWNNCLMSCCCLCGYSCKSCCYEESKCEPALANLQPSITVKYIRKGARRYLDLEVACHFGIASPWP